MISKASQPLASSAVKEREVINSISDEEQEVELMTDGSCSPRQGGLAYLSEGSVSDHDQDYSDEETDSGGADEESDGSHDGAEFTTDHDNDIDIDMSAAAAPTTADDGGTGAKVKKVKIPGLYKPPTHDELQTLRETQNLFKSNLMRLQVHNVRIVCTIYIAMK